MNETRHNELMESAHAHIAKLNSELAALRATAELVPEFIAVITDLLSGDESGPAVEIRDEADDVYAGYARIHTDCDVINRLRAVLAKAAIHIEDMERTAKKLYEQEQRIAELEAERERLREALDNISRLARTEFNPGNPYAQEVYAAARAALEDK